MKTAELRDITDAWQKEEISYSKMVELINEHFTIEKLEVQIEALKNIEGDDDEHTEKRRKLHIERCNECLNQLRNEYK